MTDLPLQHSSQVVRSPHGPILYASHVNNVTVGLLSIVITAKEVKKDTIGKQKQHRLPVLQ